MATKTYTTEATALRKALRAKFSPHKFTVSVKGEVDFRNVRIEWTCGDRYGPTEVQVTQVALLLLGGQGVTTVVTERTIDPTRA